MNKNVKINRDKSIIQEEGPYYSKIFISTEKIRFIFSIIGLLFSDIFAYYLSLIIGYYSRVAMNQFLEVKMTVSFEFYFKSFWIPVILISFFMYSKLYTKRLPMWEEIGQIIKTIFVAMVAILAILTLTKINSKFSRIMIIFLWMFLVMFVPVFRVISKNLLYKIGLWKERLLIVGDSLIAVSAAKGIIAEKYFGYFIVGFVSDTNKTIGETIKVNGYSIPIVGRMNSFENLIQIHNVSRVVVAISGLSSDKLSNLISTVQKYVTKVLIVPDSKGIPILNTELFHLFHEQLFLLKVKNNLRYIQNRFLKRCFDIFLALLLLPITLVLLSIIYLFVRLDSKGEVFYTQERIGRWGKLFKFIKIRSMYLNNKEILKEYLEKNKEKRKEWDEFKKLKGFDPRVTKIGKFLRKTSLDEIAQIFNVLKGDMSFIGPRPYLPREKKDMSFHYNNIILARPGISGLWQISGRNDKPFEERIKIDSWYVMNWSLWLDVEILIKTIKVVLKGEGAY